MRHFSTKTYGNELGLSCCFRQWKATESHCHYLHGYSIGVTVVFEAEALDFRNWVQDFGGLKEFKQYLTHLFDHTMIVAEDDPLLPTIKQMEDQGLVRLRMLPAVGCEKFAEHLFGWLQDWLSTKPDAGRIKLASVEVFEHGANSAGFTADE